MSPCPPPPGINWVSLRQGLARCTRKGGQPPSTASFSSRVNFKKGHRLGSLEEANGLFFGGGGEVTFSLRRKRHRGGRDTRRPRHGDRRGQRGLDTPRLSTRRADAGSQLVRSAPARGGAATSLRTGRQAPAARAPSILRPPARPQSRERHGRAPRALGRADPGCLGSGGAGAQTPRMLGPPSLPACALDHARAGRSCAALVDWPWKLGGLRAPRVPAWASSPKLRPEPCEHSLKRHSGTRNRAGVASTDLVSSSLWARWRPRN